MCVVSKLLGVFVCGQDRQLETYIKKIARENQPVKHLIVFLMMIIKVTVGVSVAAFSLGLFLLDVGVVDSAGTVDRPVDRPIEVLLEHINVLVLEARVVHRLVDLRLFGVQGEELIARPLLVPVVLYQD